MVPQGDHHSEGSTVDLGYNMVTKNLEDIGIFNTPTLWKIARTELDMDDGRFKILEELNSNRIISVELIEQEQQNIVALREVLTDEGWQHVMALKAPPA